MDEVTVKKDELLEKLKTNREAHAQLFKDALEGFRVESKKKIEKALAGMEKGTLPRSLNFTIPINRTQQYDEAIEMLEMSVSEEVTLRRYEFNQYILDSWIAPQELQGLRAMALSSSNSKAYL